MNYSALNGIITLVIGLAYSIQAFNLPMASIGNPMAPKYFPMGLGVIMTIFGIVLLSQSVKKGEFKSTEKNQKGISYQGKLIAFTCLMSIVYALIFEELGFVIATMIFLGSILFAVNGKKQWKINTIVALCFSVGIYVMFSKVLGIMLPMMPFLDI